MSPPEPTSPVRSAPLVWGTAASALGCLALAALLAPPGLGPGLRVLAGLGAAAVPTVAMALAWGERRSAGGRLGPANGITLGRAALGSGAGSVGVWAFAQPPSDAILWAVGLLGTLALVLDGVDGAVARRTNTASAFGARLDMEVDGTFTAALCLVVWSSGAAGAWILLSGALRGLFILAGQAFPWMNRPLYPSQRRRVVCVIQIASLLLALCPWLQAVSVWIAALGLAALIYSFGRDTLWLFQRRNDP